MKVAIVGAGITGLTTAHELEKSGVEVTVFEASPHVGGPMRSLRRGGFLAELGPHTVLESNDDIRRIVEEVGLAGERIYANDVGKRRFVVKDGVAKALPMGPKDLVQSDVFSTEAKLRALGEPFVSRRDDGVDESLTNFVTRRFGEGLLEYGFELIVNGIWAGDPNRLSVQHAFPKMYALEREYGSVIGGGIRASRKKDGPRAKMMSFRNGNGALPEALAADLKDLRTRQPVKSIRRTEDRRWKVRNGTYDAVVATMGPAAFRALDIEDKGHVDLGFFEEIAAPDVTIVTLGFKQPDVPHPLGGFGMIAPIAEGFDILGALFTSSLFEGRAPAGHVSIACFVGGMRRPDLAGLTEEERLGRVLVALRKILGVRGDPVFVEQSHWPEAIPQYEVGYGRLKARMDALEKAHRGLFIAGNVRQGVAVPDLIAAGTELARRIQREAAR